MTPLDDFNIDELTHYGIKGQKWGKRRFQYEDGTLTPAGKLRYDDNPTNDNDTPKTDNMHKKVKTTHRMNLEDRYKKEGMTKEQARQAADRRIKAEKIVTAAAVVTVAAALAYKKHIDNGRDFTVSKNTSLNRVIRLDEGSNPYKGTREYVSYKKMDNIKYKGMMGKFEGGTAKAMNKEIDRIKAQGGTINQKHQQMYNMKITPKQNIKVASVNRAKDTFLNLYKNDSEFKRSYDEYMISFARNNPRGAHSSFKQFAKAAESGNVSDKFLKTIGYKSFNISIAETDKKTISLQNKFYESLKKQGMNALVDLNDKKGMLKSSKPLITFDGGFDYSKQVLTDKEINKSLALSVPVMLAQNVAKPAAIAFTTLYANNKISNNKRANDVVRNYRIEHPNTKLTDKEIIEMLNKSK